MPAKARAKRKNAKPPIRVGAKYFVNVSGARVPVRVVSDTGGSGRRYRLKRTDNGRVLDALRSGAALHNSNRGTWGAGPPRKNAAKRKAPKRKNAAKRKAPKRKNAAKRKAPKRRNAAPRKSGQFFAARAKGQRGGLIANWTIGPGTWAGAQRWAGRKLGSTYGGRVIHTIDLSGPLKRL